MTDPLELPAGSCSEATASTSPIGDSRRPAVERNAGEQAVLRDAVDLLRPLAETSD